MEPAFLDHLPTRYRNRFRENLVTLGFVVALFVVPSHVGRFGIAAGFTIVWLAFVTLVARRLAMARPLPSRLPAILAGAVVALASYPLVLCWIAARSGRPLSDALLTTGFFALFASAILYVVVAIAFRRIFLSSLFASNPVADFKEIRGAQAIARADAASVRDDAAREFRS